LGERTLTFDSELADVCLPLAFTGLRLDAPLFHDSSLELLALELLLLLLAD
jgi:hypothetical protein